MDRVSEFFPFSQKDENIAVTIQGPGTSIKVTNGVGDTTSAVKADLKRDVGQNTKCRGSYTKPVSRDVYHEG